MAILINDNYSLQACKPFDARYLNICSPWTSVSAVTTAIPTYRYTGLTVNIAGVEYWWKDGVGDGDLVIKTMGGAGTLTGATNGIFLINSGTSVALGGLLTGNTTFSGGTLRYASDISGSYDARSLVDKGYVTGQTANLQADIDYISGVTDTKLAISVYSAFTATTDSRLDIIELDYITGATNGICKYACHDVCLGGVLSSDITFGCASNTYHLKYCTDYSGGYTPRSIPDVNYVTNIASGLLAKGAVCAATTGATDFVYPHTGLTMIDGVQTTVGMRILVKDPANNINNGIWIANTGLWTRAGDFDGTPSGETVSGSYMWVLSGDTHKDTSWVLNTADPIIVNDPPQTGDTALNFVLYNHVQDVQSGNAGIVVSAVTGTHYICLDSTAMAVRSDAITGATNGIVNYDGRNVCFDGTGFDGNSILWSGGTFNVDLTTGSLIDALDEKLNIVTFTGYTATTQQILDIVITGATNIGIGTGVYSGTSGQTLIFNTIIGSGNTSVQKIGDEIVIYSSGGSEVYNFASPSICPTGGMCVGTVLTGKTALKLLQEILVPELCGTLTPPSFSTTLVASTTYYEIGCSIPTLSVCGTFNRGCINPQYSSTSDKRVGYATCYVYTGAQVAGTYVCSGCSIAKTVTSYVVSGTPETWGITVCYGAGVQPLGQYGTPFNSACLAGSLNNTKTICGVYPIFATTSAIGTLTKQAYVTMTTNPVQLTLVAESGGLKDRFEVPYAWTGGVVKCVCTYNTFSSAWEWEGGSGAASLTTWTPSVSSETLCCGLASYCLYTYNGACRLTTTCIRLVF